MSNEFVKAIAKSDYTTFEKAFGRVMAENTKSVSRKFAEEGLAVKIPKSDKR